MEKYFKRKLPLESEVTPLVSSNKKKFLEFVIPYHTESYA